jgi:membrane-associated protease RseP (regulator of RpoE activity)
MTLRNSNVVILALSLVGAALLCGASGRPSEVMTLPALKVYAGWIAVNYYQDDDGLVTRVLIQEVTPNSPAARARLRKGDELVAIDEVSVAGMSEEQFINAYANYLPPDGHRDYDFRCYRGFFRTREQMVRFRLTHEPTPPR